ncbi:hypothetical protein SBA4_3380004 [Candidatus Sulfopaludibacter sp. SbA4]|nr:hypothetical protein SBA4_3380004 [Candidatus Sulfopaludibacter sp. SbA4]
MILAPQRRFSAGAPQSTVLVRSNVQTGAVYVRRISRTEWSLRAALDLVRKMWSYHGRQGTQA